MPAVRPVRPVRPYRRSAVVADARPRVTAHASRVRRAARGLDAPRWPRPGAVRHPRGVPPTRRLAGRVGVPLAPQAPDRRPGGPYLVGARCHRLVDRRALRRRLRVLRPGRVPALCHESRGGRRQPHLLHRVDLLHHGGVPAVSRGRLLEPHLDRPAPPPATRTPPPAASPDRLVGFAHPADRHAVVQPHYLQLVGGGPRRCVHSPPGMAARRVGLGVLPRIELAGVGGGVPRLLRLAPPPTVVVDHVAQPGRLRGLRGVGRGLLREAQRRAGQPGVDEPRHLRRRRVLPRRRRPAAARADAGRPAG